jgi:hypothetical protein
LPDNPSVTPAIQIDVDDPQNKHGNTCGGDGFHELLTMIIRQSSGAKSVRPDTQKLKGAARSLTQLAARQSFLRTQPLALELRHRLCDGILNKFAAASSLPADETLACIQGLLGSNPTHRAVARSHGSSSL